MDKQYAEYRRDLEYFQNMTEQFYRKEISVKDYKGFSGRYGSYAQRGAELSMLRLRMNGGQITKDKLKFVVHSIRSEKIDKIHFTTCQTIQLHNLKEAAVSRLILKALDHQIVTWGGGGDFPRNVMVSPLSGVQRDEYFDVMPYAQAAADYLLTFIDKVKLPRKLKVGFSNSPLNETHVTFRDFGFAATKDGRFDVYSAGGLGSNPKMGVCMESGVDPAKILYYLKAMIDTFVSYGNYENRAKARTRYMQDEVGAGGYAQRYREKLAAVMADGENLDLVISPDRIHKAGDGSVVKHHRVTAQKQEGLYAVYYHPIGGTPSVGLLEAISETISDMDQVEVRLTPDQGLYLINCTGKEAEMLLKVTAGGAENLFESSVACIGASVCQVGVRDSQKVLQDLVDEIRSLGFEDGVLPRIHISGCPSSCGTHQIGRLGFHGGVKMVDKVALPAFTMHVNGSERADSACFGQQWGVILEKDLAAFLIKTGKAVQADGSVFEEWIGGHMETLHSIAEEFLI